MSTAEQPIKPYAGSVPASAETFADCFPAVTRAITKRGVRELDDVSAQNLKDLRDMMRQSPPKPATIVNLHPWKLLFPVGDILLRGIEVPACEPGEAFAHLYIRKYRHEWKYNDDAQLVFKPVLPITLAQEFVREFSNVDGDGGGVLIYEGEIRPDKAGRVNCYNQLGQVMTEPGEGVDYDEQDQPYQITIQKPVQKPFKELYDAAIEQRNAFYLRKIQEVDRDYKAPETRRKIQITDKHFAMADVLFKEGIIPQLPEWRMLTRLEMGLQAADQDCPACGSPRKGKAFMCTECQHVFDPLQAYLQAKIPFTHVAMDLLTPEQWVIAEEERVRREGNKRAGQKAFKDKDKAAE